MGDLYFAGEFKIGVYPQFLERRSAPGLRHISTRPIRSENPHYHGAMDTPETLDYPRMAMVTEGLGRALIRIVG